MPTIKPHTTMEDNLRKYSGLTLYIKEMDESWYQKLCAVRGVVSFVSMVTSLTYQEISLFTRPTSAPRVSCTKRK